MSIEYSEHAKIQMARRSISESEVLHCLYERSICYPDKKGNFIIRSDIDGRGIKVVVAKENQNFIITVADY